MTHGALVLSQVLVLFCLVGVAMCAPQQAYTKSEQVLEEEIFVSELGYVCSPCGTLSVSLVQHFQPFT